MTVGRLFPSWLMCVIGTMILVVPVLPTRASAPPDVTPQLAACATEDGAGMALCWWDAHTRGNGRGTSVVSGDCAEDITRIGWCVKVYRMGRTG